MTRLELLTLLERLYRGTEQELRQQFVAWLENKGAKTVVIFTPNPEQVWLAHQDSSFLQTLLQADVLLPDGAMLVAVSRRAARRGQIGSPVPERITGVDVLQWWLQEGNQKQKTLLLGGKKGVANALAYRFDVESRWCKGTDGYHDIRQPAVEEEGSVHLLLREFQPAVVFVGFGAPWQEWWVLEHQEWLAEAGVRVVVVCGGALDVLSPASRLQRSPAWMRQYNLEWLWRLLQQPGRWRRHLNVLRFLWWARSL